jgi:hypothetical protein
LSEKYIYDIRFSSKKIAGLPAVSGDHVVAGALLFLYSRFKKI